MLEDRGQGLLYLPILNYASVTSSRPGTCSSTPGRWQASAMVGPTAESSATRPSPPSCSPTGPGTASRGERLPLEWMVKKQTHDTARLYGLTDRGTLEPGCYRRPQLIDYDGLQLGNPTVVTDLPAGGRRLIQDAIGYVETIKSGVATFDGGQGHRGPPRGAGAGRPLTQVTRVAASPRSGTRVEPCDSERLIDRCPGRIIPTRSMRSEP